MTKLILENNILNIEDLLENNPSVKTMLEDNIITQEEKNLQTERVLELLVTLEKICTDEQLEVIRKLMSELCALIFVSQIFSGENR